MFRTIKLSISTQVYWILKRDSNVNQSRMRNLLKISIFKQKWSFSNIKKCIKLNASRSKIYACFSFLAFRRFTLNSSYSTIRVWNVKYFRKLIFFQILGFKVNIYFKKSFISYKSFSESFLFFFMTYICCSI